MMNAYKYSRKNNLAWALLTHDKLRLFLSLAGVGFAVVLIFVELGFMNGILDSQTLLLKKMNADLYMVNQLKNGCYKKKPFSRVRLMQALKVNGVEAAYPIYMEWLSLKNIRDQKRANIWVLAFDTDDPALLMPDVNSHAKALEFPWTVLIDTTSRKSCYGRLAPGVPVELAGRNMDIIETFTLFSNYSADGHLIMSSVNFFKLFSSKKGYPSRADLIEFGLIKLASDSDPITMQRRLQHAIPGDVQILTRAEIIKQTKNRWMKEKPVMEMHGLGMTIGFIVGCIICYQILFTEISDHRSEFATIKAIGYSSGYLMRVVLQESLYISLIAFFPGLLLSVIFYYFLQNLSGILMQLSIGRIMFVLLLTVTMCFMSAMIAIRKVIRSDPAELF